MTIPAFCGVVEGMGRGENPVVLLGGVVEGMGREELPQLTLGEAVGEKNFESRIDASTYMSIYISLSP